MSWQERDYAGVGDGRGGDGYGLLGAGGGRRFADNPLNWSPTLGHIFGIRVRIHITLILFLAFELISDPSWLGLGFIIALFGSVFLHELGHCFAARRMGGHADDILMWPLGGLASVDAPRFPWPQFVTVICGPLVNVSIGLLTAGALFLYGARFFWDSDAPFIFAAPTARASWTMFHDLIYTVFYVNAYLFVFNLLPMYPMDGGRMLHCALWKKLGYSRGTLIVCTVGMVTAVVVGLSALASREYLLLAIAFIGYVTCYQERMLVKAGVREEDGYLGHDFSAGYASLNKPAVQRRPGWLARWRERRQRGAWQAERQRQDELREQVDAILDKVRQHGIASLSRKEKKLLEEATDRQRRLDREHGVSPLERNRS